MQRCGVQTPRLELDHHPAVPRVDGQQVQPSVVDAHLLADDRQAAPDELRVRRDPGFKVLLQTEMGSLDRSQQGSLAAGRRSGFVDAPDCEVLQGVLLRAGRSARLALDHDALDLVERDRVRRPVVELRRLRRRVPRDPLGVLERPPVGQVAVIPVARNVWQHVVAGSPAATARRLIIASTARRPNGRPLSRPARSTLWKSGARASSRPLAATYASTASSARWCAGTSWRFPPFSCSRSHPRTPCRK